MTKSNKPVVWGLFAAGGTVAAFVIPVLILVTLLAVLGHAPPGLSYERLQPLLAGWTGKLIAFVVISLSLWGSAHRLRITFHDFGVRADRAVAALVYLAAGAGALLTVFYLLRI